MGSGESVKQCPTCGAEVAGSSKFCRSCGNRLPEPAVEPAVEPAPQPPAGPPPDWRRWRVAAAAAVALAAIVALVVVALSGEDDSGKTRAVSSPAPAKPAETATERQTTTEPSATPPPPEAAEPEVTSFKTPRDAGEEFSAAYCRLKDAAQPALYCWTPNDGYTLELRDGAGFARVPDDDLNRGVTPGGYTTLDFGSRATLPPFECTSSSSALSCVDEDGRGFRLPRYRGFPQPLG